MSSDGTTKDLKDSKAEAIQALLNSISPGGPEGEKGGNLTKEQARRISDKLDEILGDKVAPDDGTKHNDKGELVNEEGLPIIDITEPVQSAETAVDAHQISHFDDPDLLPLWALSPQEKARRKAERERVLDALEEEERLESLREAEVTRAKFQEELEKRKEAQKYEVENLQRARELQKKMGRALLRSVVESREQEEKRKAELEKADQDAAAAKKATSLKPKKSVTFADQHEAIGEEVSAVNGKGKDVDWGDVSLGRLRLKGHSEVDDERRPMKMHVVERHPRVLRSPEPPVAEGDSDDEDAPGSLVDADSDNGEVIHSDNSEDDGRNSPPQSDLEDDDDDLPADEELDDWGAGDFDYARHQREVALEYYEKRKTIGSDVTSAMRAHSHDDDNWNQLEVPLEASLASAPKPSVSRFKAEHIARPAQASTLASHSLAGSILPSSQSTSLQRAVRMGKLEDGRLVGGEEGDSDGEIDAADENTRAMLEMLKKGEVTNIGPVCTPPQTSTAPVAEASQPEPPAATPMSQPKPSKVSKFKMSIAHPASPTLQVPTSGTSSAASTPIEIMERSSPKMHSPREGTPDTHATAPAIPSMIVESPEFPRPTGMQMPSMIVESPDFPHPGTTQMPSMIVDSPDFPPPMPTSTAGPFASTSGPSPLAATPLRPSVIERRPPTIVPSRQSVEGSEAPRTGKQKVSRFKAQRSQ